VSSRPQFHVIHDSGDRHLLVDEYCRKAYGVTNQSSAPIDQNLINELLLVDNSDHKEFEQIISINVEMADVYSSYQLRKGLLLLTSKFKNSTIRLNVYFTNQPNDWLPMFRWIDSFHEVGIAEKSIKCSSSLTGPFESLEEDFCDYSAVMRVQLNYAITQPGVLSRSSYRTHMSAIAKQGARIVATYVVDANNIDYIYDSCDADLQANQYSGLSLPLSVELPGFANHRVPSQNSYRNLVSSIYDKFPHYDDVLYPICQVMENVKMSGWNRSLDLPRLVNLYASRDGVSVYRLFPKASLFWLPWGAVIDSDSADYTNTLCEFVAKNYDINNNRHCRKCEWYRLCGGVDDDVKPELESAKSTACQMRLDTYKAMMFARADIA
jgi:hypothetical protein